MRSNKVELGWRQGARKEGLDDQVNSTKAESTELGVCLQNSSGRGLIMSNVLTL